MTGDTYDQKNDLQPQAESTVPWSESLETLILQAIPDLLMVVRQDGQYLQFLNGGSINLYLQGQEAELMNLYACLPPHLAEQRMALIQTALKTGQQQNYEYAIEVQGERCYEEARIVPINQEEVLVMVRDITDRKQLEEALHAKVIQEHLLNQILTKIRQSLELQEIFDSAVAEVRQFLEVDRVLFYRFEPDWSGIVVAESVEAPWVSLRGHHVVDHCLSDPVYIKAYLAGRVHGIADVHTADISDCHLRLLESWEVQANLLVPVKQGEQLYGLFAAQSCCCPRQWQDWEVQLMQQIAEHFAMAIQQGEIYQQLQFANQELERLATTDSLTQVANRLRFDAYLSREWYRMQREQQPLSLILFDLDYFKQYNDVYGHLEGDHCLIRVAQAATQILKRPSDFIARYGGEEFAILLSNTPAEGACSVAEAVCDAIRDLNIPHQKSELPDKIVTISLGVATLIPQPRSTPKALVQQADVALYRAKLMGRNRCDC